MLNQSGPESNATGVPKRLELLSVDTYIGETAM